MSALTQIMERQLLYWDDKLVKEVVRDVCANGYLLIFEDGSRMFLTSCTVADSHAFRTWAYAHRPAPVPRPAPPPPPLPAPKEARRVSVVGRWGFGGSITRHPRGRTPINTREP